MSYTEVLKKVYTSFVNIIKHQQTETVSKEKFKNFKLYSFKNINFVFTKVYFNINHSLYLGSDNYLRRSYNNDHLVFNSGMIFNVTEASQVCNVWPVIILTWFQTEDEVQVKQT